MMSDYTIAFLDANGVLYAHVENTDGAGEVVPVPEDHPDYPAVHAMAIEQQAQKEQ